MQIRSPDEFLKPSPGPDVKGPLSSAFQYACYVGYRALAGAGSLLSLKGCETVGTAVGTLAWHFAIPYRRLVRRNLRIAFEGEKEEAEIQDLGRRHFQRLCSNTLLSFKFGSMDADQIEKEVIRYEGLEHFEAAAKAGKGVIAVISHLGPWELFAQLPSLGNGVAHAAMYRPLTNPFINRHIVAQRERIGVRLFDRSTGVFGPLKHLREGGGLGILIDQHSGDHGIWCPFFGRLAATTNLPALLSLRTGAAVLSCAILPDGDQRWKVVYHSPHFPDPAKKRGELANISAGMTVALNRELENSIRTAPAEWFWVHNRWKTPNPRLLVGPSEQPVIVSDHDGDGPALKPFRLLLRSPNPLGDACMAMPAVRAIKRGRPDLHLTVLCRENLGPVWRTCPQIDDLILVSRKDSAREVGRIVKGHAQYDAAVLLPNSLSSALEATFAGIPRVFGFRGHWRRRLLDYEVPPLPVGPPRHHAHSYLKIAQTLGADISEESILVDTVAKPPEDTIDSGGCGAPLRLGVCPGAEYGTAKRWPEERFAEVVNRVRESIDCEVTLFGSPNETLIGESLTKLVTGPCENLVGKTDLEELIEGVKNCDAVLTNDTGTMHLAAMLDVPTVAIFGSTEPKWTRPLGSEHRVIRRHVECSPCFLRECPLDFRCMTEIDPGHAVEAIRQIFQGDQPVASTHGE